jgi:HD-GYP domain-containing protein (c-di-GMP phosphodiesterase class II)
MLHDVGLLALSADLRRRCELGFDERDTLWRGHVEEGHRLLSGAIDAAAAGVVLNHHQHYDGSGFPTRANLAGVVRSQQGPGIHVFSRIACVADHFDRLRHAPDGTVRPRVRVLRQMLFARLRRRFDPVVLGALLRVVPAYPPGSMVRLSTGHDAVVVGWDPGTPCRPTIRRIALHGDAAGGTWQGEPMGLVDHPPITVVEHDGVDVSGDNFEVPRPLQGVIIDPDSVIDAV